MQNEYKIIQYSSNPKIYKYNSSIYLCLCRLLDDSGLSIVRLDPAPAPTSVTLFFIMISSRVNLFPRISNPEHQKFNHLDTTV